MTTCHMTAYLHRSAVTRITIYFDAIFWRSKLEKNLPGRKYNRIIVSKLGLQLKTSCGSFNRVVALPRIK